MGRVMSAWATRFVWIMTFVLVFSFATRAQQESSSRPQPEQSASNSDPTDPSKQPDNSSSTQIPGTTLPVGQQVYRAGTPFPLLGSSSLLRWGPIYLGGFEAVEVYDSLSGAPAGVNSVAKFTLFRTNLVFDRYIRHNHFLLQAIPRMVIINGQVHSNVASSDEFTIDDSHALSPRLTLRLREEFSYIRSRDLFPADFFQADPSVGSILQSGFVDIAGSYLRNTVTGGLAYQWTPRTTLTAESSYSYAYHPVTGASYLTRGHAFDSAVGLTHALSATRSFGVVYETRVIRATGGSGAVNAVYHSVGGFYAQQLSRTWWIRGGLQAQILGNAATDSGHRLWGNFSLVKAFDRSSVALAYNRGQSFAGYLTNRVTDRADVAYDLHLTAKWDWRTAVGYFRELGGGPRNSGKYGNASLEYRISPSIAVFTDYLRKYQDSPSGQLLAGTRNLLVVGMRWFPPSAVH